MHLDTLLKNISITALFAVVFVPLIIANDFFFPFITGKNFTFRILVEIAFASYVILALRNPQYRPRFSYIAGGLAAFVAVMAIATLLAENPFKAFWSNFERMEGYITVLHLGAYFVALSSLLSSEKQWNRFFTASVIAASLVALYGIAQLLGLFVINQGGVRLDSTFGNAAYLAVYMMLHIFITIFLMLRAQAFSPRMYLLSAALVLEAIALYYTETRGAMLGLVVGGFIAALISLWGKEYPRVRIIASGLLVFIMLFVGTVFVFKESSFIASSGALSRFATISLDAGHTRFTIWDLAFNGFQERPIFGWGQEGFNFVFNKYYEPHLYTQEPWFDRAHNIFLDWLIAGGILGLLGYLSLYAFMLYLIWFGVGHTFSHLERAVLTGLLAGYFVNNIFVFDNIGSYIVFFSLLAFVHAHYAKAREWRVPEREEKMMMTRIAGPVAAVAVVLMFYFGNWSSMQASFDLIRGMIQAPGGYAQNLEYFEKSLGRMNLGLQETREQLMQRALTVQNDANAPLEVKQRFQSAAKREIEQHILDFPGDARIHVFYGSFLRLNGDLEGSVTQLSRAHELSPGKQSIQVELALAQLQTGKPEEALATAKDAYERDTSYEMGTMVYAAILNYANKGAEADALLMKQYGTTAVDHDILIQTYADTKQYKKALALWKGRAEKDPENPEIQAQLARTYAQSGDKAAAIAIIEKLMQKYPEFDTEGKKVIEDIRAGKL